MRMKEDHMKNGQLKPAYNVQISTEDQFILNYTIHQKPGDTTTLIPHLNIMRERIGLIPPNIIADAGYGSLENYEFLSENKLKNFVKYNNWLKDFRGKSTSKIYVLKDFIYNKENDYYTCIRSVDVEPVFGMIKNNRYFKRFMLRGLEKVNIEWGLLSLAHNFIKLLNKQKVEAYS